MTRRPHGSRGITLVETLATLLIVAVAGIVFVPDIAAGAQKRSEQRQKTAARRSVTPAAAQARTKAPVGELSQASATIQTLSQIVTHLQTIEKATAAQ